MQSHDPVGRQPAAVLAVTSARTKLFVALGGATAGGAAAALPGAGRAAPLIRWDILALVYGA